MTIAATTTAAATMRGSAERSSPPSPSVLAGLAVARGAKNESHSGISAPPQGHHYRHLTKVRVRRPVGPPGLTGASFSVTPASDRRGYALFHPERAARLAREELPHELVVRVEQLRGGAGLDDPALPQDRDVLRNASCRHDVVRYHDVGTAVLLMDLLDELAEEG